MIMFLRILFSAVWLFMVYIVVSTSLESSLVDEWDFLGSIPWMRATLWDFYANVLVIFAWVCFREKSLLVKIIWAIVFFCLGSIGTVGYLLIQLFGLKPNDSLNKILQAKA